MWAAGKAAADRPKMGEEKLIIRSEKVRFIDILSMLILRRPITSYAFVDVGDQTARDIGITPGDIFVKLTEVIQKALASINTPAKWVGIFVEFFLNLFALNGGLLGIIGKTITCRLVIPRREAANFRTIIGMIDGRTELKPAQVTSAGDMRQLEVLNFVVSGEVADLESGGYVSSATPLVLRTYDMLEITVMSAKIAYENAAFIENVVNNVWKFNFVGFYNGWNKFLKADTTQAFVCTDRGKDASIVVVAFRGTEPFNMQDWSTDVNLSWLGMGPMGHVHVGFLKALGLQEEDGKDVNRAFPKDAPTGAAPAGKVFAYYKLREVIREQLTKHPKARLVVTGHSLGGALAAVFPAVLALHEEKDILARTGTVRTYGQPRVGDDKFVRYFRAEVEKAASYYRVVYRYDVVPRVPFDIPLVAQYAHGGMCVYYDGWYDGKVLPGDAPNPNYFDPRYLVSMYGNALGDLVKGAFLWVREGRDYREGLVSLLYRGFGLVIPGLASHSPRDYVNGVRLGRIAPKEV
ncbi:unnamed protein product [Alopecurus aequalis]